MDYLRSQMQNVVSVYEDPDETFNHMDFFASPAVGGRLNSRLVEDMVRYSAEHIDKDNKVCDSGAGVRAPERHLGDGRRTHLAVACQSHR